MAAGSKSDPNDIGVDGEYAGFVAPKRADASTVSGAAGSYYPSNGEAGNTVDRKRINKTSKAYSPDKTTAKPAGPVSQTGY